jgi:GNAT superfamily N-acetyltransferase
MPEWTFKPVTSVDFELFTAAFNRAYSDYFMPIIMTVRAFRSLVERDDLDMSASVAALEGPDIVGTGLLGIRGAMGWIGGMGVVPERRRRGIGRQMMHYLLERAHERGLTQVFLEVIEANEGAYALYHQIGFQEVRHLLVLDRNPKTVPAPVTGYVLQDQSLNALLAHFETFHDVPNCWQRGYDSLAGMGSTIKGYGLLKGDRLVGYALGWADTHEIRLADIASVPDSDRYAVSLAILSEIHRRYPKAYGNSYNISEDDPALPAFLDLGYTIDLRQIEMRIGL